MTRLPVLVIIVLFYNLKIIFVRGEDPCEEGGHKVIDDFRRHVEYITPKDGRALCDVYIRGGWHRFLINGTNAILPTQCVEVFRCGTQAPIWLELKSGMPLPGHEKRGQACAAWQLPRKEVNCCMAKTLAVVKNCGNFYIYRISGARGCNLGYCTTIQERSCEEGLILDPVSGDCTTPVTESTSLFTCPQGQDFNENLKACIVKQVNLTKPSIQNVMVNGVNYLNCTIELGNQSVVGAEFRVAWYKRREDTDTIFIIRRNMMGRLSLLKLYEDVFPGDLIQCGVMVLNTKDSDQTERISSPFNLGLKFSAESVLLQENFPTDRVTLYSTIPISCGLINTNCSIEIMLALLSLDGHPTTRIRLNSCRFRMYNRDCENNVCSKMELILDLLPDLTFKSANAGAILTAVIYESQEHWQQVSTELMIRVEDKPFKECYIFADPHVQTFDGRLLDVTSFGTYLMFSTKYENFMVHARMWNCSGEGGYCVCGVALRYKNDRIIVDMCQTGKVEMKTQSSSPDNFKIKEALNGRYKYILFSSGSRFKITIDTWGMAIALMIPGRAATSTPGFCGTVDANISDNLIRSSILNDGNSTYSYIEQWRLKRYKTLFEVHDDLKWVEPFSAECDCSPANDGYQCSRNLPLDNAIVSVFNTEDTSNNYASDIQNDGSGLYEGSAFYPGEYDTELDDDDDEDNELIGRRKFLQENLRFEIEREVENDNENLLNPIWQRGKLIPEEEAHRLCSEVVINSPISVVCSDLVPRSIDTSLNLCLRDVQLKLDSSRVKYNLKIVEDMCENEILKTSDKYISVGGNTPSFPDAILKSMTCPYGCNQGKCTLTGCICETDFGGLDCSVHYTTVAPKTDFFTFQTETTTPNITTTTAPPPTTETTTVSTEREVVTETFERVEAFTLQGPRQTFPKFIPTTEITIIKWNKTYELCDINIYDCTKVVFFIPKVNPRFQCKLTPMKVANGITRKSNNSMLIGIETKRKELDCMLPPRNFLDRAFADMAPVEQVNIEVLNGRRKRVAERDFVIYDSTCRVCIEDNGCRTMDNMCYIDGKCQPPLSRNIKNRCQQCIPSESISSWTGLEDNLPPVFDVRNKQVVRFLDDVVRVMINAYDPEGDEVVLGVDHPEAVIVEENILIWNTSQIDRKETPKLELFDVFATDICNFTSKLQIQIIVVACACLHNGTCSSGFDSISGPFEYTCSCPGGYTGKLCEVEINDCEPNPCNHGTCIDYLQAYQCVCPGGYKGVHCEISTDLCNDDPCYPGVVCLSSPGSFACTSCPPGLTGDGVQCTEIDSCLSSPCFSSVTCKDMKAPDNGFICGKCPRFFIGDGVDCKKKDVLACEHKVCSELVECSEIKEYPGYSCSPCPDGYEGNGTTCTPICNPPCGQYKTCYEPDKCRCPDGYTGNRCQKAICDPPCQKGGLCTTPNNCTCFTGYKGKFCEILACNFQCLNGGRCMGPNKCKCRPLYYGFFCERKQCSPTCLNGGRCTQSGTCRCPYGYYGKRCQNAICNPSCLHGGRCKRKNTCKCPYGYAGDRCQTAVCRQGCNNQGRCKAPDRCSCKSGWSGYRCDKAVCDLTCKNSGHCFKPNICICKEGYTGSDCSRAVCKPSCKNRGRCLAPNYCWCRRKYFGDDCKKSLKH
ncbi:von Willebrand factor D and EGF domain-containing protein isoform X2 [Patella vulgata]|uniref:von Willebrand factor D and EGF domain-containing protein isoform X2 n=1 Tax=Patella vulgata TaxID=6465 RepID=UPI00217FA4D1|nr:von Willebrand factor D and EGF domain-containing protein isoform X2 [Patella vulgata]